VWTVVKVGFKSQEVVDLTLSFSVLSHPLPTSLARFISPHHSFTFLTLTTGWEQVAKGHEVRELPAYWDSVSDNSSFSDLVKPPHLEPSYEIIGRA